MAGEELMNLKDAADLAGCSRKTLYRYMAKKRLMYHKAENNRRYVQRHEIEDLFPRHQQQKHLPLLAESTKLVSLIEGLRTEIEAQSALIEKMIGLYQPKTLAELMSKRDSLSDG